MMKVFRSLDEIAELENAGRAGTGDARSVVTIGNFDGVHCGHQSVIRTVRARAQELGARAVVTAAGAVLTASYLWLWLVELAPLHVALHMAGLVIGVVVLDVGAQMMQVANQTRIFGLGNEARSRINTVYMTMYFIGGAVGSALASQMWARWGWNGVCALALTLLCCAGLWHAAGAKASRVAREPRREAEMLSPEA